MLPGQEAPAARVSPPVLQREQGRVVTAIPAPDIGGLIHHRYGKEILPEKIKLAKEYLHRPSFFFARRRFWLS
jgi:hypothetical protein